ncbi:hypothetical protein [Chitinophaga sp.]|uniref:hypothetical protein n=1 Tax=Chitinophaga sp. TaxID=1869181 RepID=UPI002F92ABBE
MKQAKIALTAVAVLAVVGGALAFKAQRGQSVVVYTATEIGVPKTTYCSIAATVNNATTENLGASFTTKARLTPAPVTLTGACPTLTLYSFQ